ncbi:MAG TPA: amino acid permease [Solirubrobacteraceae bacterium]
MAVSSEHDERHLSDDEKRLAELGYTQELKRAWSGFSNFAISFTIISILSGCFTTYQQAWLNGGPVAISWGWPIICGAILIIAFCMAELASAYPTAGGIYWWASKLGGPVWGWFTGWFNLIGLVAVTAAIIYGTATFSNSLLGVYGIGMFEDDKHVLRDVFMIFAILLLVSALVNIFSSRLLARMNNVSAVWHVLGVVVIVGILAFVPDHHASADFVFTERLNESGFGMGMYWYYVLPLGFLLTMYTQTGYDASAHISEETVGASKSVARGVWQSVFWAAVFGWAVLLALTFAAADPKAITEGGGSSIAVLSNALSTGWLKAVLIICTIGQIFCGIAAITSSSRMLFAFSRDRAVPGWRLWTRLTADRVPAHAVVAIATAALVITLPALYGVGEGGAFPVAFFAVTSIAVIGLYIAYVIPVYLRWRMGDRFEPGPWNLGRKYKWMNPFAVVWVILMVIIFSLPFTPAAVPWHDDFTWESVNYAPIAVGVVLLGVGLWWVLQARRSFKGPIRQVDAQAVPEIAPEFQ